MNTLKRVGTATVGYDKILTFGEACDIIRYNFGGSMLNRRFGMSVVLEDSGKRSKDRTVIWKCLCDCGKVYKATNKHLKRENRPRSCGCSRIRNRLKLFESKFEKSTGCWQWKGSLNSGGYGKFKSDAASRWAYILYREKIKKDLQVCHTCDNRLCVNPDHLFLGSIGDNMRDRTSKGRQAKGSSIGSSKLTEDQVLEIRKMRIAGNDFQKIADRFDIQWDLARKVCKNNIWKHVPLGVESKAVKQVRRAAKGSAAGGTKLSEEQVIQIKSLILLGKKQKDIAFQFGVNNSTICDIAKGRTWSHL